MLKLRYRIQMPPRSRTFRHGLEPREPMELTVESILASQLKRHLHLKRAVVKALVITFITSRVNGPAKAFVRKAVEIDNQLKR